MSNIPTIRQASFAGSLPGLIVLTLLAGGGFLIAHVNGLIVGAAIYLTLRFSLRQFIPRDHRQGMSFLRRDQFDAAISCFDRSYDFFERRPWIDRFRSVFLLSGSDQCYREMALNNAGFSCSQIGDGARAKKYYQRCLKQFPENGLAASALKMLDAGSHLPVR